MYTITYNLKPDNESAENFYRILSEYSSEVYAELDEILYDQLLAYFRYYHHEGGKIYTHEEGYLELLTLGVLWCVYSGDALATQPSTTDFLQMLADVRENSKQLKPIVDAFRGICLTAMMSPDLYDHMGLAAPTLSNLNQLLDWLEATGEFKQEVLRLRHWENYLDSLSAEKAELMLETIISLGLWFEKDSIEGLGEYTEQVDRYLNELRPKRYWKEDVIFCGRRRVEYHLNMVGAEWLNKAYRQAFLEKTQRVVLLPTCMSILPKDECKAHEVGDWLKCVHCSEDCQVSQLSYMESEYNFQLFMVPHSSSLKVLPEGLERNELGIIGVACALNLISGGFMLAALNIPAQCVLLNYSGCKQHWHPEGMPTSLHAHRLVQLLSAQNNNKQLAGA